MDTAEWVTKTKFEALSGMTHNQIRSKVQRGVWRRGIHYAVVDGRMYLNPRSIDEWISREACGQLATSSRSDTASASGASKRRSTFGQLNLV